MAKRGFGRCSGCPLEGSKRVPFAGNTKADIVLVGESPGNTEISLQQPFVGRAGKLLVACCKDVGLSWLHTFRANSARCLIPKDKLSAAEMREVLARCRPNVEVAIKILRPKVLVALGDVAMNQLVRKRGITKHRGRWIWSEEFKCWVIPAYHPSYCLRPPDQESKTILLMEDLNKVAHLKNSGFAMETGSGGHNWRELQSIEPLLKKIRKVANKPQAEWIRVALDTETTSLDVIGKATLPLCYSISWEEGEAAAVHLYRASREGNKATHEVTVFRPGSRGRKRVPTSVYVSEDDHYDQKMRELAELLSSDGVKLYFQHGAFDIKAFRALFNSGSRPWPGVKHFAMDTQAAAHVLHEGLFTMAALEDLQFQFTDLQEDYSGRFKREFGYDDITAIPRDELTYYAAGDADTTLRVAKNLIGELAAEPELLNYFVRFVQPVVGYVLPELEWNGTYIDLKQLPITTNETAERLGILEEAAFAAVPKLILQKIKPRDRKLTKTLLLHDIMFQSQTHGGFGVKPVKHTNSGKPSLDNEARSKLLELSSTPKKAKRFLEHYAEWRELHTLYTRYLRGFDKNIKWDGRIHSTYSLCTARTGRLSSREPNMMNNPKRSSSATIVRRLIATPPGYVLMAIDQGQAELRWTAHLANDPDMIRVYQTGDDIHLLTAETISGKTRDEMTPDEKKTLRQQSKAINFGVIYLMSPGGFVRHAKLNYGLDVSEKTAKTWIEAFFNKYKKIPQYHDKTIEFGREHGYVASPFGRRRHFPDLLSSDWGVRKEAERQAVNHPIQGASSDTVLLAMREILWSPELPKDEVRMVNMIHDEVVLEVVDDEEKILHYAKVIKRIMENPPLHEFGIALRVPLECEVKVGHNFAEMHEVPL